jgi:hypothetical protein
MTSDESSETPPLSEGKRRLGGLAVAGWGLLCFAGTRAIELVLESQSMAASVGQAVLAEWGGSRLGVSWSAPEDGAPATIARRVGIGAALGLAAAGLLFVLLRATNAIVVHPTREVSISLVLIGLATAALNAMRDELLLHGVTLRALADERGWPPFMKALACGLTSAGAALGAPDANARSVAARALFGIALGALWIEDRGAFRPWAAHAAFLFATTTLLHGGVVDARIVTSTWSGGESGLFGGVAAVVTLAPFAVLALGLLARKPRISPSSPGVS